MNSKLLAACTVLLSATAAFVEAKIRLEDFYDFGTAVNDQTVPVLDDGSTGLIKISTLFPFFNHQHDGLYVNNNGVISFLVEVSQFTPIAFPLSEDKRLIAPFWADVDIRNGGTMWYRETTDQMNLERATRDVRRFLPSHMQFRATWLLIATWKDVAFYGASDSGKTKRNTFQAVLITNGQHSFSMFNYNKIEWVAGTASGGDKDTGLGGTAAQAGFNAGDGVNTEMISGSRTKNIINITEMSNVNIPGKFFYRIDDEKIRENGGCTTNDRVGLSQSASQPSCLPDRATTIWRTTLIQKPQPSPSGTLTITPRYSTMLGGEALVLSGPCFTGNETVSVKFGDGPQHRCSHIPNAVSCVTQSMFTTGDIPVILSYVGEDGTQSTFQGVFTAVNPALLCPKVSRILPRDWKEGQSVSISWDKNKISSELLSVDLMGYKKIKSDPHLILLKNLLPLVKNANGLVNFRLPKLDSIGNTYTVVIRISEITPKDLKNSLAQMMWSDVFLLLSKDGKMLHKLCQEWYDKKNEKPILPDSSSCPCSVEQASLDSIRFHTLPFCNGSCSSKTKDSCLDCLYHGESLECFTLNDPIPEGSTIVCCYNDRGSLISAENSRGASVAQKFPYQKSSMLTNSFVPYLDNLANDVFPYEICCQKDVYSDDCRNFLKMCPPVSCKNYRSPRAAGENGDPHFFTLDGKRFTFNGVGEYILMEDLNRTFSTQIRTEQVKDVNGTQHGASVMTALAIMSDDIVQIEMNTIRIADIRINGNYLDFANIGWLDFEGGSIKRTESNESVTYLVRFRKPQMSFKVTANKWLLNVLVVVGSESLKGNLHGLLGNYNGDPNDDFVCRNGSILLANSTDHDIHFNFGQTWITEESESIFKYAIGKSHSSFQKPNFQPTFLSDSMMIDPRIKETCGNNKDCIFDYTITGNEDIAMVSQTFSEVIYKAFEVAMPVVSCGIPNLNNGSWNASGWTEGSTAFAQCRANYTVRGEVTTISCMNNGQWSSSDAQCKPIVTASNNNGPSLSPWNHAWVVVIIFFHPYPTYHREFNAVL